MNSQVSEKQMMRMELSVKRAQISSLNGEEFSKKICDNLEKLATYRYADGYLMYYPLKNEVDIVEAIDKILKKGKKLYLPRCEKGSSGVMDFYEVKSIGDLEIGSFGVMEPRESCRLERSFSQNFVCIVPAIAFDKEGFRIGYGKGYYDRFLRRFKGTKIGVSFSELVMERVPRGKYDNFVDILITEKGALVIR
ncbi:MAG: 5-formyltetrahydrofolate cyclo-ligase [Clostridia bacterium]|nr:5-formyltetrahydrofolate cyclo-ligase [Clostridia bacterium]